MSEPHPAARALSIAVLVALAGVLVWSFSRPARQPVTPRLEKMAGIAGNDAALDRERRDAALVRQLIAEDLDERRFRFGTVMLAASDHQVLPLQPDRPSHRRVLDALETALERATEILSRQDSPVREQRRINEASRYFEEALRLDLDAVEGLNCGIPETRDGDHQRSGYPDLRVVDESSGDVFYLDPKLVENGSWDSSLRTFYFEPKDRSLKINDDAVHLLVGIGHDGKDGAWTFGPWKVVDLSTSTLRLKPEFQAANRDLYPAEP
jgi:hypothetical protein